MNTYTIFPASPSQRSTETSSHVMDESGATVLVTRQDSPPQTTLVMAGRQRYCHKANQAMVNASLQLIATLASILLDQDNGTCLHCFSSHHVLQMTFVIRSHTGHLEALLLGHNLNCWDPFIVVYLDMMIGNTKKKQQCALKEADGITLGCVLSCVNTQGETTESIVLNVVLETPGWNAIRDDETRLCEIKFGTDDISTTEKTT